MTTFPFKQCQITAQEYAVDGCPDLVATMRGSETLMYGPHKNLTGITVSATFAAASLVADLHLNVTYRDGTVQEFARSLVLEGSSEPDLTRRAVAIFAVCDVESIDIRLDEPFPVAAIVRVYAHVTGDLEYAKREGTASCNDHIAVS